MEQDSQGLLQSHLSLRGPGVDSIPTIIDDNHAIAHNRIIIIDQVVVITGSFNFTKAAEEKNAEDLLFIKGDAEFVKKCLANFKEHLGHSERYDGSNRTPYPRGILGETTEMGGIPEMKVSTDDMISLLECAQGKKKEKQAFIGKQFRVSVPRTNHKVMWQRLAEELGREKAIDAVFSMVLASPHPRLIEIIKGAQSAEYVRLRAEEPVIVKLLFSGTGKPKEIGQLLVNKLARSRAKSRSPQQKPSKIISTSTSAKNDIKDSRADTEEATKHILPRNILVTDLANSPPERGIKSSRSNHGWKLERVTGSRRTYLEVNAKLSEIEIEDYLEKNWGGIDIGMRGHLFLVGRQVKVKGRTTEKVDFVARKPNGAWVAIELKKRDADGNACIQLLSYMRDLSFTLNIPKNRVSGILLAPGFHEKILNSSVENPRVRLLKYIRKK